MNYLKFKIQYNGFLFCSYLFFISYKGYLLLYETNVYTYNESVLFLCLPFQNLMYKERQLFLTIPWFLYLTDGAL